MLNSKKILESFLQKQRFKKVLPFLGKDVLDFGGNRGELKQWVKGNYTLLNNDHKAMEGKQFDTIVSLAVIEHLHIKEVYSVFRKFKNALQHNGVILVTTPTTLAKPVLELLAWIGLLDKKNILEHKHYWRKKEIYELASRNGFVIENYSIFQFGFNQFVKLKHRD